MYPTLSDLIYDLLGIYVPLPIQMYGFFLGLAFIVGAILLTREFKRLEALGKLHGITETLQIGKPISIFTIIINALPAFIIGWKGTAMLLNWEQFSQNPQEFVVSTAHGNLLGGLLLATAMALYTYFASKQETLKTPQTVEQTIFPHQRVPDIIMIAAVAGILGSKLFDWIEHWDDFLKNPLEYLLSFSGLTFYGGLICAAISIILYARTKKIPIPYLVDAAAPALMICYAIGRLGCHFAGDGDWGVENFIPKPYTQIPDWLWGYRYPNNVIDEGVLLENCTQKHCHILPNPVFPTPVYEFIMCSAAFLILMISRSKIKTAGLLFCIYLIFNGLERFFIELFRINNRYNMGFMLSQAQIIALILIFIGVVGAIFLLFAKKTKNQPTT